MAVIVVLSAPVCRCRLADGWLFRRLAALQLEQSLDEQGGMLAGFNFQRSPGLRLPADSRRPRLLPNDNDQALLAGHKLCWRVMPALLSPTCRALWPA